MFDLEIHDPTKIQVRHIETGVTVVLWNRTNKYDVAPAFDAETSIDMNDRVAVEALVADAREWVAKNRLTSLEAKCPKCGTTVAITDIDSAGVSYVTKPDGFALTDLCPVIVARNKANKPPLEENCPYLEKSIDERMTQFRQVA